MRLSPWLLALVILTIIRLTAAALVPLAPDEAYYWLWSQHLQAGYYDDAPLIALWIRAGTWLLGPSALGIRLLSPLGAMAGSLLIWQAGEDLFPERRAGLRAAILLNATLVLGAGAVITTPDTPLLLFWTAGIAALARWRRTGDDRWWLAAGACAGLALDAKYTGLLLIAAIGVWLLSFRNGRRALRRPYPWIGLVIAFLLFLPVILWNARHQWASLLKQGGRVTQFHAAASLHHFLSFIGGQIALATPIIAVLMGFGVWRACRAGTAEANLVALAVLLPGAVFAEHVLSGPVQPNWPAILYPGAALAAAGAAERAVGVWLIPASALGLLLTFIIYIQAIAGPFSLPPQRDPTAFQLGGWPELARQISGAAAKIHAGFITAPDYATLAELSHDLPPAIVVAGYSGRWQYFHLRHHTFRRDGLLVQLIRRGMPPKALFSGIKLIGTASRRRHGRLIARYDIYQIAGLPNATLIKPAS